MVEKFYSEQAADIYCGDALQVLKSLPDESVQMTMTSPPYWGLRNYAGGSDLVWGGDENCEHEWHEHKRKAMGGHCKPDNMPIVGSYKQQQSEESIRWGYKSNFCSLCGAWRGQLGLEPTPELYVEHLMMIFREVKRVLKKDGSFYLNIGDTYNAKREGGWPGGKKQWKDDRYINRSGVNVIALPPKCMVCIPERVLFAMLDDGWILRNKIVWHKPNAMPSSVKDRFTASWEYLYFFTKARKYYFDLDAVREPHKTQSLERYQRGVNLDRPAIGKSAEVGPMQQYKRRPEWFSKMFPPDEDYKGKFDQMIESGANTGEHNKEPYQVNNPHRTRLERAKEAELFGHGPNPQSFNLRVRDVKRGKKGVSAQSGELKASEKEIEEYEYPEKIRKDIAERRAIPFKPPHHAERFRESDFGAEATGETAGFHAKGKNPGDVIQIDRRESHQPREKGGHELPPTQGEEAFHPKGKNPGDYWDITTQPSSICVCPKCDTIFPRKIKVCPYCKVEGIVGHFAPYPESLCETPIKASSKIGDMVLDPLAGGGATGVAAKRLGRKCILIDCVKEYCVMAKYKLEKIVYQPELT